MWDRLRAQSVFVTGGTGFIGKWLLATLLDANERLNLGCRVTVLSRDPSRFSSQHPQFAKRCDWVAGDVRQLSQLNGHFDVIVHGATDVAAAVPPHEVFSACIDGTRQVVDFANRTGARDVLLLSSGAVYGTFPIGVTHVPESYCGGPDPRLASSAYGEGKRAAEWLLCNTGHSELRPKIARVFALVGPYLPLDKQFAIGNFMRAALRGDDLTIRGDGTPFRSYLHAADMAAWLWTIALNGQAGSVYNVGSEEALSIVDLAHKVCRLTGTKASVNVLQAPQAGVPAHHYVPDISKIKTELSVPAPLGLDESITRTTAWLCKDKART